jgi:hypothetical protein
VTEAIRLQSEARVRLTDRINAGVQFKLDSLEISRRARAEIPARLPGPYRAYLNGYIDARIDMLWRDVEFRYLVPRRMIPEGTQWHATPIIPDPAGGVLNFPVGEYGWLNAGNLDYGSGQHTYPEERDECEHAGCYVARHNPYAAFFWKDSNRPFTEPHPTTDPEEWAA